VFTNANIEGSCGWDRSKVKNKFYCGINRIPEVFLLEVCDFNERCNMPNKVLDAIMGSCVADALGVPVEFTSRHSLANNPVVNMRSCGTFNLPAGTWSDDTSMTLCLLDSLSKGLDYQDIMTKFYEWFDASAYTPYGETFDVGFSTTKAMKRFAYGIAPLECGGTSEQDNGNGSLMRILPVQWICG